MALGSPGTDRDWDPSLGETGPAKDRRRIRGGQCPGDMETSFATHVAVDVARGGDFGSKRAPTGRPCTTESIVRVAVASVQGVVPADVHRPVFHYGLGWSYEGFETGETTRVEGLPDSRKRGRVR